MAGGGAVQRLAARGEEWRVAAQADAVCGFRRDVGLGEGERVPVGGADVQPIAWGGDLAVLQWAREHGCPWGDTCGGHGVAVGARAWLRVGHGNVCVCC